MAEPRKASIEVAWPRSGVAQVLLRDEHDLSTAAEVEAAFARALADGQHVIADLTLATFIDCSTIRALVRARSAAVEQRLRFHLLLGRSSIVEVALTATGVLPVLNPAATLDDALDLVAD
jgi:anti-anti-sigma factor